MAPESAITQTHVYNAFDTVYRRLCAAYWAASTIEGKDTLRGVADLVQDALLELDRSGRRTRADDLQIVATQVRLVTERLRALDQQIDGLVHAVRLGLQLRAAIESAIGATETYLGLQSPPETRSPA